MIYVVDPRVRWHPARGEALRFAGRGARCPGVWPSPRRRPLHRREFPSRRCTGTQVLLKAGSGPPIRLARRKTWGSHQQAHSSEHPLYRWNRADEPSSMLLPPLWALCVPWMISSFPTGESAHRLHLRGTHREQQAGESAFFFIRRAHLNQRNKLLFLSLLSLPLPRKKRDKRLDVAR